MITCEGEFIHSYGLREILITRTSYIYFITAIFLERVTKSSTEVAKCKNFWESKTGGIMHQFVCVF